MVRTSTENGRNRRLIPLYRAVAESKAMTKIKVQCHCLSMVLIITAITITLGLSPAYCLEDDCECRSGWREQPRIFVPCPGPLEFPECPQDQPITTFENPECENPVHTMEVEVPGRIIRDWRWEEGVQCNYLPWLPGTEQVRVRFPSFELPPCTKAKLYIKYNSTCFVQSFKCTDVPEKVSSRLYHECMPRAEIEFEPLDECPCEPGEEEAVPIPDWLIELILNWLLV